MLSYLELLQSPDGGFPWRLFGYTSVRCIAAAATAFLVGMWIAPSMIERLRALKANAPQRSGKEMAALDKVTAHKKGTPAMGGLIIAIAFLFSCLLWVRANPFTLAALVVYVGLAITGFVDDYLKVLKRNADGIAGRVKILAQFLVAAAATAILLSDSATAPLVSQFHVPFIKAPLFTDMPWWAVFGLFWLVITASSNAINLTDGVDGLAIGCTISTTLAYAVFAYSLGHAIWCTYLGYPFLPGCNEITILLAALLGASLAFLWYNAHPAQVWMGDTGSLALGGLIGVVACMTLQPVTLVIVGAIFVMEAGSVMLQVGYFKLTKRYWPDMTRETRGRRLFLMSPIHHHFQLKGWHENQVVIRFWILSLICSLAGLATLKLR